MSWVITGGAGFIGTNFCEFLVEHGIKPIVVDNLSRPGVERNALYLQGELGIDLRIADVADRNELWQCLDSAGDLEHIVHLAGQVSFMASIKEPLRDFQVNGLGTLNVLEYVRTRVPTATVVGMSSNKVYGDLAQIEIVEGDTRFIAPRFSSGFGEDLPLDCHGPYGCSKGLADQYLADYGRTYGLKTASLRQSSVYGPHQHPQSDQGWLAHIVTKAMKGEPIQLSGNGKQVRDLLHAADLANLLYELSLNLERSPYSQFNVGGGAANSMSLLEVFGWLRDNFGVSASFTTGPFRPSDQMVFVSNNHRIRGAVGWTPKIDVEVGMMQLTDVIIRGQQP